MRYSTSPPPNTSILESRQDSGDATLLKDPEFASPDFFASPQSTETKELTT